LFGSSVDHDMQTDVTVIT